MNKLKMCGITFIAFLLLTLPAYGAEFNDLKNHWAAGDINKLLATGTISGYPDGSFRPDGSITRAEFSTMLCKGLTLTEKTGNVFSDMDKHWAKNTIHTLVEHQIILPPEYSGAYLPNTSITRREMAVMLVRAMGLNDAAISRAGENTGFSDNNQMNLYDTGYILLAKEQNLIGGYEDNTFRPNEHATRAEATVMLVRLLGMDHTGSQNQNQTTAPSQTEAPAVSSPAGVYTASKNGVTFQIEQVQSSYSSNQAGEQYLDIRFDLTIQNQSNTAIQSTSTNLKFKAFYPQGQVNVKIDPYSDTIAAQSSKTRQITAHILLPTTPVAQLTLGAQITGFQIFFTDIPTSTSDIATIVNSADHTVYFDDFAAACLQKVK